MKLQLTPVFGALVIGTNGIVVTYANGTYTFSLGVTDPVIATGDGAITGGTAALAIVRDGPVTTHLTLPLLAAQNGTPLTIFDFSTNVVDHTVVITPYVGQTIMKQPTWTVHSVGDLLGTLTLVPAANLGTWYIR